MDKWPGSEDDADDKKTVFSKRMEDAPLMDHDEPSRGSKAKYIGIACLGIALLVVLVYFGGRAMTGYAVYGAMQESGVPGQYASDMQGLASELSRTQASLNQATSALAQTSDTLASERAAFAEEKQFISLQRDEFRAEFSKATDDLNRAQNNLEDTTETLSDAAKRLCCAQRAVADPNINSYSITDNKVMCTTGGQTPLSC
jgi:hypothetical protein